MPAPLSRTQMRRRSDSPTAPNSTRPPGIGRVDGIQHQVQKDADQLTADADYGRQVGRQVKGHGPPLHALVVLGDAERFVEHVGDGQLFPDGAGRPAEVHQLPQNALNPAELVGHQRQLVASILVVVPPAEELHDRADRGQRVADLVSDAGRQQAERGHLFLVQQLGLGLLQFAGPLGDADFQVRVQFAEVVADPLEQQRQRTGRPGHPH